MVCVCGVGRFRWDIPGSNDLHMEFLRRNEPINSPEDSRCHSIFSRYFVAIVVFLIWEKKVLPTHNVIITDRDGEICLWTSIESDLARTWQRQGWYFPAVSPWVQVSILLLINWWYLCCAFLDVMCTSSHQSVVSDRSTCRNYPIGSSFMGWIGTFI